jgi:hypothetical protein
MRDFAERNVEQARAACGQFMDAARKAQNQGRHARRQMAAYSTQAQVLGRLMAGAVESDHTR